MSTLMDIMNDYGRPSALDRTSDNLLDEGGPLNASLDQTISPLVVASLSPHDE